MTSTLQIFLLFLIRYKIIPFVGPALIGGALGGGIVLLSRKLRK